MAATQQGGCGYTAQTPGPFDVTLRDHEVRGRLFLSRYKGVIFHSPREKISPEWTWAPGITFGFTHVNSILVMNENGSRRNICGERTVLMPCGVIPVHYNTIRYPQLLVNSLFFFLNTHGKLDNS